MYLKALELGFKGSAPTTERRSTRYESRLRKLVGRASATIGPLVPECYEHTTVAGLGLRLPGSRMWWSAAVAIAAHLPSRAVVTFARFRGSTIEDARQRLETSFGRMAVWQ